MVETISISVEVYQEYLKLKKINNELIKLVCPNLQDLKEGKVYDL